MYNVLHVALAGQDHNIEKLLSIVSLIVIKCRKPAKNWPLSVTHLHPPVVEPPLMDTSHRQTPLISEPLVMFCATYKHYIFYLLQADTCLKRPLFSGYGRFDCACTVYLHVHVHVLNLQYLSNVLGTPCGKNNISF